ncbi:MAG: sugar phosphate isomerase/epimerase [Prevotella sp.]|jgi:sugar phosphate isomerase/epimerase|nr:sugar phosphate isomerase/epimerase [Prevotella sp.]
MDGNFIKRGVTIYSFRKIVSDRRLNWEECISKIVNLGITGVELLGQMYFRECPDVNIEDVASWKKMMWRYGTKTVAHDFFIDKTMFKGRNLTIRESLKVIENHIKFAKAIDCPIIRVGGTFNSELFRMAAPLCEDYGIKLGVEIHAGTSSWVLPSIQELISVIKQANSPYLGIIPDMGMFQTKILDMHMSVRRARSFGLSEQKISDMKKAFEELPLAKWRTMCLKMEEEGADDGTRYAMRTFSHVEKHEPEEMAELMPLVIHIHGKFWEMDENNEETMINYKDILPIFVKAGYDGYISAEYEGVLKPGQDAFEPQERFQKMLDKYLGFPYPSFPVPMIREPSADVLCLSSRGFKNRKDNDGKICGIELYARCFYYRGIPLCLVDNIEVTINDVAYNTDKISFEVDGELFTFAQMATVTQFYWNYGHFATIIVELPGGLDENRSHKISLKYNLRTYYLPGDYSDEATLDLRAIK